MAFDDFKEQTLRVLNLKTDFDLDWFERVSTFKPQYGAKFSLLVC